MTTIFCIHRDSKVEEFEVSNHVFSLLSSLGAFISVGVWVSPDGKWWYSDRFENPSAHGGITLTTKEDCARVRASLRVIAHAVDLGTRNGRDWSGHLTPGLSLTLGLLCESLAGATSLEIN